MESLISCRVSRPPLLVRTKCGKLPAAAFRRHVKLLLLSLFARCLWGVTEPINVSADRAVNSNAVESEIRAHTALKSLTFWITAAES